MRRKLLALGVFVGTSALAVPAFAQGAPLTLERLENDLLIVFIMVASVLVFLMHAGFALVESGFARAKNAAHVIMKNLMTLAVGLLTYYAVGFGVMYGSQVLGLFGTDGFFLTGFSEYEPLAGSIAIDFFFQGMFAATAATIISGAMAERMKLGAYIITVVAVTTVIYPVVGAWKWGGGWLDSLGFADFAGSTLVHMTGGVAALVGAAMIGPRVGRYAEDGSPVALPGHSLPLGMLGVLLLFFGWFGFNGGSVLAVDGQAIARVLVTTALAGAAGAVGAAAYTRASTGVFDVGMTGNGILAGLVGITAGADVVSNLGAVAIGAVCGIAVVIAAAALERVGIDDPVGAVAVHGACGLLGTAWVGLASTSEGLLYGGGARLLGVQLVGAAAVAAYVAAASALLFVVLRSTIGLRVSPREEIEGLDLHEHGIYAYPELAVGTEAYPAGPLPHPALRSPGLRAQRQEWRQS